MPVETGSGHSYEKRVGGAERRMGWLVGGWGGGEDFRGRVFFVSTDNELMAS